jgi:hypothetical protein
MRSLCLALLLATGCGGTVDHDNLLPADGAQDTELPTMAGAGGDSTTAVPSAGTGGGDEYEAGAGGEGSEGPCVTKTTEAACPSVGAQQQSCGTVSDGCDGEVDCGSCSGVNLCGTEHVCQTCTVTTDPVNDAKTYCPGQDHFWKAYRNCAFTFHDCMKSEIEPGVWCCSF